MKIKRVLMCLMAIFTGFSVCERCFSTDWSYKCPDICDGEVIIMEPLTFTYYIYPDREHDDLANKTRRTVSDIEKLIDHVLALHPDSAFSGEAESFIIASNETGLDPLFFFSLAGIESAWGTNKTHLLLSNPYSIHMFGDGVNHGYKLGETFGEGIVNGAIFIYEEYYKAGQTTLYLMNHNRDHSFCAGDTNWEYQVASEMAYLDEILRDY